TMRFVSGTSRIDRTGISSNRISLASPHGVMRPVHIHHGSRSRRHGIANIYDRWAGIDESRVGETARRDHWRRTRRADGGVHPGRALRNPVDDYRVRLGRRRHQPHGRAGWLAFRHWWAPLLHEGEGRRIAVA